MVMMRQVVSKADIDIKVCIERCKFYPSHVCMCVCESLSLSVAPPSRVAAEAAASAAAAVDPGASHDMVRCKTAGREERREHRVGRETDR